MTLPYAEVVTPAAPRFALSANAGEWLRLPTEKARWAYPSPAIDANLLLAALFISLVNILDVIISDKKVRTDPFNLKVKFILIKHHVGLKAGRTRVFGTGSAGVLERALPVCSL
jgi:hypothetical protein